MAPTQDRARVTSGISITLVGVGNCAKNFCEFLAQPGDPPQGRPCAGVLGRPNLAGYERRHLRIAAAFDIDARKVGRELSAALVAAPNCASSVGPLSPTGIIVERGPTLDSLTTDLRTWIRESSESAPVREAICDRLRTLQTDVVVVLVPSGSNDAVRWWAETCVAASCSMINATAAFMFDDQDLMMGFRDAGVCYIGDDMKSQLGATVLHSSLLDVFERQGITIEATSQINMGGNTDFANLAGRSVTKIASKSAALFDASDLPPESLHVGLHFDPTRGDEKRAVISIRGKTLCGSSVTLTSILDVDDSGNAVAVLFDAVRCASAARDRGEYGYLDIPSVRLMKRARRPVNDVYDAYERYVTMR